MGRSVAQLLLVACALSVTACSRTGGTSEDLRITNDDRRPARPRDPNDESAPAEPAYASPVIVLDDKQLTIDGQAIPLEPHVSDFVAILGKAERLEPSGNTIHVYESRGLLLYESAGTGGRVIELTVIFRDQPSFPFTPKKFFAGTLLVQGMRIDEQTTLDGVSSKLTAFKWEHGLGDDVDTFISKHQTFFIANDKKVEVAEVAISFPYGSAAAP